MQIGGGTRMEGCSSWLLARRASPLWLRLPLASPKGPKAYSSALGRQSPGILAQPSSEMLRTEVGRRKFFRLEAAEDGSAFGHCHLAVQCWAAQVTSLILDFSGGMICHKNDAFFTGCCEDQMGFSCEGLSTALGTW